VTAVSIFHAYFNGAAFFILMPVTFFYIVATNIFTAKEKEILIAAALFFSVFISF